MNARIKLLITVMGSRFNCLILASLDIYQKAMLIIYTIDRCDPEVRHELVEALALFLKKSKDPVKIFISSRTDPVLKNQLESSPTVGIHEDDNQEDIKKLIDVELERCARAKPFLESIKPNIIAKLLEHCQGMFQWVSLQTHQIGKSPREEFV